MSNRPQSNIKFIHCRNIDKQGVVSPKGGLTVAYCLNNQFKVVGWAAAKCNNKDTYNKHVGRMKAAGRMLSAQYYQDSPEIEEKTFIQQTQEGYQKNFNE